MSHGGEMPDIEATHALHTTAAPKAVEEDFADTEPPVRSENEVHLVIAKNGMATTQDTEEFMGGPIP